MKYGKKDDSADDGQKVAKERRVAALYSEKGGPLLGWHCLMRRTSVAYSSRRWLMNLA